MSKKSRVSLSVRLQPYSGTLLAEVASWLNSLERDEVNRLIAEAIIMAYLPYARAATGAEPTEIERCCWETQDMLDKHGFNLRQALRVRRPQWQTNYMMPFPSRLQTVGTKDEIVPDSVESSESIAPQSQIEGEGNVSDLDAIFGDD